jgi:hypothetical protein
MRTRKQLALFSLTLGLGACATAGGGGSDGDGMVQVEVKAASAAFPIDGQCAHVIVTRTSDFLVSEYLGPLDGATFQAHTGEHRVTATAFPEPCNADPAQPAWNTDAQLVTFANGQNTLKLDFKKNVNVDLDPTFTDAEPAPLSVRAGSTVRIGRNGEGAAGPSYSLDGWELKSIALPPAAQQETVLFSTEGKGPSYSPRGVASLADGTFVFGVAELSPVWHFSAGGALLETWPVLPAGGGMIVWDNTDGIATIDDSHFVRTGWLNLPIGCDANGNGCIQSGLDILEKQTAADGTTQLVVTQQVLPNAPGLDINVAYPVGVTATSDGKFVVAFLSNDIVDTSELVKLNADGTLAAGPANVSGDVEGLFQDGARIIAVDYEGVVTTHDAATLAPGPDAARYDDGVGVSLVFRMAWSESTNRLITLASDIDHRLAFANPDFTAISNLTIDLSQFVALTAMEVKNDSNELLLGDRPASPPDASGNRYPLVHVYDLATQTETRQILLQGVPQPTRTFGFAYLPAAQQLASFYRRPNQPPDPIDSMVFLHHTDGSFAGSFDLRASAGVVRIAWITALPASNELLVAARDTTGVLRLIVTSPSGQPKRSYRVDSVGGIGATAQITTGQYAGDVGATIGQPSQYLRLAPL